MGAIDFTGQREQAILTVLAPLRTDLDAALTAGEQRRALGLAYKALVRVADDLATAHGEADPGAARIDALWVRLTCQPQLAHQPWSVSRPFEALADGTLREAATAVWPAAAVDVWHRSWHVTSAEAAHWTERLIAWVAE